MVSPRDARPAGYGEEGLARFRYHTGATVRPLDPEETCAPLFRDVGMEGVTRFLEGRLARLGGPMAPVVWMRTERWREPYTDHGRIGRLVLLRPFAARPWHAGVAHCYVAPAGAQAPEGSLALVPGGAPDEAVARAIRDCACVDELREALGRKDYDLALDETRARIASLRAGLARTEPRAAALRRALQRGDAAARDAMAAMGVDESDLCTAWHHLPDARRAFLVEVLG